MTEIHKAGPLAGMASVSLVIGARETEWLQHAAQQLGRTIDDLVRTAAEESALDWAKAQHLSPFDGKKGV